jgi:hypothetical protein
MQYKYIYNSFLRNPELEEILFQNHLHHNMKNLEENPFACK